MNGPSSPSRRRVAVTGVGVVCAIGSSAAAFWDSLEAGRSGIGPLSGFDADRLSIHRAAQVGDFDPAAHFEGGATAALDRFAAFAVVTARQAVEGAALPLVGPVLARTGVVTGSGIGGQVSLDEGFQRLYGEGRDRVHPLTVPRVMPNAGASHISMELGVRGPAFTTSTACSSSNHAIGLGYRMVRDGSLDVALVGGSEAPLSFGGLKAWEALRVVAPDTCRPFSADRRGLVLGEGGAILVLEPLETALDRGVEVLAEVVGFGMSADAHHITASSVEGPSAAMRGALADAGLEPERIGYINAHGTGTRLNDRVETAAIKEVFGDHAGRLAVSSTKSMHGHALGGAGAIEAAATVLALRSGVLPPTANFTEPDPECDLDVVPNEARARDVEYALSNSFAFGGLNAVLAFRKWHPV